MLEADGEIKMGPGYLDNARRHPIGISAARAIGDYANDLLDISGSAVGNDIQRDKIRSEYAKLINAAPCEVALVPSTVFAESLVLEALGLPDAGAIVTDSLHFAGSLYRYAALKRLGHRVTIVRPHGCKVRIEDYERAIVPGTRLVVLSLVSALTGFTHDLKAVTDVAHARGALVYADIIQAAGNTPIDVRESGVDFCACSSYKWLMGDMGGGFLYARDNRSTRLRRPIYGLQQLDKVAFNGFPHARPEAVEIGDWSVRSDARGLFEAQTLAMPPILAGISSLALLQKIGIEAIEAHRQPLLNRLRGGLEHLDLKCLTPEESRSAIISFSLRGIRKPVVKSLDAAGVTVSIFDNFMRVAPSFFNDAADIECLIEAVRAGRK